MALEHLDWQQAANDNRRACPICDGDVTGHRAKKYCGKACARKAEALVRDYDAERSRRLDAALEQDCEECGATFKGVSKDGKPLRFCSRACGARHTKDANTLAVLITKAIKYGYGVKPVTYSVYRPLCDCCGKRFNAPTKASRLCSDECKAEYARRSAREYALANDNVDRSPRSCLECGDVFTPEYGSKLRTYCGDACRKRSLRRAGKSRRNKRIKSTRKEPIYTMRIFERDGWQCRICGIDTPRYLRGTHEPNAPELDHIFPLAKGGAHASDNVQCLCRECNQKKSDNLPVAA